MSFSEYVHVESGVISGASGGVFCPGSVPDGPFCACPSGLDGPIPMWRPVPPDQIEVVQGEKGEDMGGVLGKTAIPDLPVAPQVLDDAKRMFDPCPDAIALPVERTVRAVKATAPAGLAKHPPFYIVCFGPFFSRLVRIGLVAVDHLLLAVQTGRHHLGIVHRSGGGCHAVHPSLRIAAHMGLHAEMPGVALLRAGHSGSRLRSRFFVDDGAWMIVASTIVPSLTIRPRSDR